MTQTLLKKTDIAHTPARRELPSAPVLIRVPVLIASRVSKVPARRRRLRREVRVAGSLLILALSTGLAYLGLAGNRLPSIAASTFGLAAAVDRPDSPVVAAVEPSLGPAGISLSLEPSLGSHPARDFAGGPVLLSGQLLPVDSHEEPSHGGH